MATNFNCDCQYLLGCGDSCACLRPLFSSIYYELYLLIIHEHNCRLFPVTGFVTFQSSGTYIYFCLLIYYLIRFRIGIINLQRRLTDCYRTSGLFSLLDAIIKNIYNTQH